MAVFDVETNGMSGSSVLSASSIVFDCEGAVLGIFNRFYFPAEHFNASLTRVHNLTPARLAELRRHSGNREDSLGSSYFADDWPSLIDFWDALDVAGIVVHNLRFDISFLPEIAQGAFRWWCSMRGLTDYCAIPKRRPGGKAFKWPRLEEAAGVVCSGPRSLAPTETTERIENAVGEGCAHVSLFDCFELYRVVSRIAKHHKDLIEFAHCAAPYKPPQKRAPMREVDVIPRKDSFTANVMAYEQKVKSIVK